MVSYQSFPRIVFAFSFTAWRRYSETVSPRFFAACSILAFSSAETLNLITSVLFFDVINFTSVILFFEGFRDASLNVLQTVATFAMLVTV